MTYKEYSKDYIAAKKLEINNALEKRKINSSSRNTLPKTTDELAVSRHYRANEIDEPTDRLVEDVQIKNIEIMNYIKGVAILLDVTEFVASKISYRELDSFKEIDSYQYKKSIINGTFNDFNKSEIDTSIKILLQLKQPVPLDLQYIQQLYSKYPKNNKSQHKQALQELITEHFPNMSLSNVKAIASG